jgi:gluconolactonase
MSKTNLCLRLIETCAIMLLIAGHYAIATAQTKPAEKLFTSSAFTAVNSFTSGAEGPAVDKNGNVYAVNFKRDCTIGKINQSGEGNVFIELPNGSIGNGIRFNKHGDMFIADYINHNILKVDMATKKLYVFAHEARMNQPNDIAIDSKDHLYASDPDWKNNTGKLWRIDANGKISLLEENMGTANGIEVSPDEKTLYVNESTQHKVWAYNLASNGEISDKRLFIEFPDFELDGMRCDVKGNLYITRPGKGTVVEVSPGGKILREINLIGKKPSNLAFGGKDGRNVYVTLQDNGNLEMFYVNNPGREWKMIRR